MLRGRFVAKNNRAIWADASSTWGRPQAARLAHLVAAELYRAHGDGSVIEVRKNARTGISRVVVSPGGFCDLGNPAAVRHARDCVVSAARIAESVARISLRMDLQPAGSGASGAQDKPRDVDEIIG